MLYAESPADRPVAARTIPTVASPTIGQRAILVIALGVPAALCVSRLNLDLWYDEACTVRMYASRGWATIATSYDDANNHLLYSMLLRPFLLLSRENIALRLPSLVFSIATLVVVYRLGCRLVAPAAGLLALLWLGLTQTFLIHTMQVRGYGLSICLTALLFDWATRSNPRPAWTFRCLAILGATALLYTIPTNVLFIPPLAVIACANVRLRGEKLRCVLTEAGCWLAAGLLALLSYAPILRRMLSVNRSPGDWSDAARSIASIFRCAAHDAPWLWALAALGLLPAIHRALRSRTHDLAIAMPAIAIGIAGPFLTAAALGIRIPFDRTFTPILPFVALAAGWGTWEWLDALRRRALPTAPNAAPAGVGTAILLVALLPPIASYPRRLADLRNQQFVQDGYFCYYAADFHPARVAEYLKRTIPANRSYFIATDRRGHYVFNHYLDRAGLPDARLLPNPNGPQIDADFYYIAPAAPLYADISARSGVPTEQLRRFPMIADFGYFRLYRSPTPLRLPAPAGSPTISPLRTPPSSRRAASAAAS